MKASINCCVSFFYCRASEEYALEMSKKNAEKHFLLIGVQENLGSFLWTLEQLLPSYFDGLYHLYAKESMYLVYCYFVDLKGKGKGVGL